MSRISTHMQNLVTIPQGVSFPVCAKLGIKDVYSASFLSGFFQRPTAQALEQIFTHKWHNTSNDAVPRKDVRFSGLGNKNLTFTPRNSPAIDRNIPPCSVDFFKYLTDWISSIYSDLSPMTYSINWPITVRSAVPFRSGNYIFPWLSHRSWSSTANEKRISNRTCRSSAALIKCGAV